MKRYKQQDVTPKHFHRIFILIPIFITFLTTSLNGQIAVNEKSEFSPGKYQNEPLEEKTHVSLVIGEDSTSIEIDPGQFGAKGDGVTDDSVALQSAFSLCSKKGLRCKIPKGKHFLVRNPLYIWGGAILKGEGDTSSIIFNVPNVGYLLNVGISGRNKVEAPFVGTISDLTFKISDGKGGRIIFIWRADGAQITENVFDVGPYSYSATSSGNDARWLNGVGNYVRKNITIRGNQIKANATNEGSEGIGLGNFDGAVIENNRIDGVGDDPIGIHFCKNIKVLNNDAKSVDGRIYISNSKNVEIAYNRHERVASGQDGKFYAGIALLYIGFETFEDNEHPAPTNINAHHNTLVFPKGAVDEGGAIYLYGPRNVAVKYNQVVNDSPDVKATGFRVLPANFSGHWKDPDRLDPPHVARVWTASIVGNTMTGKYPLPMVMTGNCADYKGDVLVEDNLASDFQFYCDNVKLSGNSKKIE